MRRLFIELLTVKQAGIARTDKHRFWIELNPEYREAMTELKGFKYLNIFWWFNHCGNSENRSVLTEEQPYSKRPALLGTFVACSLEHLNPITLTCAQVTYLQMEERIIGLAYFDAPDQSPILNIKPYTSNLNRVEHPDAPAWCAHQPKDMETSGEFDWSVEFNFQEDGPDPRNNGVEMVPQSG